MAANEDVLGLPGFELPAEQLWPDEATAREILRRAQAGAVRRRADLSGQPGKRDGSGTSDVSIFEADGWCLKTSERRRHAVRRDALDAMGALGASKRLLGGWMPPSSALAVAGDADGAWRLWTVAPWLGTLRERMGSAERGRDEDALGDALVTFAELAEGALRLALSEHVVVDLHPSNFGHEYERWFYLDDDVARGERLPSIGYALLQRVDEYAGFERAAERYLSRVERALASFTWLERTRLDLAPALEQTIVLTTAGRRARARLVASLSRGGR